jgi:hypothetical protein
MPSVPWDLSHSHGLFRIPAPQMKESYTCHIRIICKFLLPTFVPLLEWDVLWLTFLDLAGLICQPPGTEDAAANVKA